MTRLLIVLLLIYIVPFCRGQTLADTELQLSLISPDGKEITRGSVTFNPLNAKPRGKFIATSEDAVLFEKHRTFSAVVKGKDGKSWYSTTQKVRFPYKLTV
jgi:hypothetical protein